MKERIGFVGIGLMGQGMATNIVTKGWPLTVVGHRNRKPVEDLVALGATEAASLPDLARASDIIFFCLTGSPEVASVIDGLKPGLAKGTVIIDCSTSDPVVTERLATDLAALGVDYADAPLSRTPKEAMLGTLDCMVGADDAVFERIEPVIAAWAAKIVHVGPVANGHKMKLLNNFISLGYAAIYSEALSVARKVGIPPETLFNLINGSRMDCGFFQVFMAYTIAGDYNAHKFTISNAYKDLRYLESMANASAVATHMSSAIKNSFGTAMANGGNGPENYVPHLADFIARANGIDL